MGDDQKIRELQRQIDELSDQMGNYQQRLSALQKELDLFQDKEKPGTNSTRTPSQNSIIENFIGLRIIHLVGIVVLVTGLSIGVKYAIDRQLISEGARIILAYMAGITLYLLSWRLKRNYQLFSAILFSGAMASLYFTTYAAFVYYGFFSFALTFLMMVCFTVYTAFESILYNRQEIAVLGMVGAYGIPFLISANTGRADLFFSYIVIINIGIVFLSFQKKWRVMSQLALLISWTLFVLWESFRFHPEDFKMGFIFLVTFYLLFIVSALAYRVVRKESLKLKDIQQVTTNNLAFYFSALILFGNGQFGAHLASTTGWMAFCLAILTLLSYLFFRSEIILQRSMALQVIILLSLFIGFNWSGLTVTLLWVALAGLLFVFGIYGPQSWPRLTAILLMSFTLAKLIIFDSSKFTTIQKIIAYIIIGALLLVLSFYYQKFRDTIFKNQGSKNRTPI
jgi:uncharacterized membrane protein